MKQIAQIFLEGESPTLIREQWHYLVCRKSMSSKYVCDSPIRYTINKRKIQEKMI